MKPWNRQWAISGMSNEPKKLLFARKRQVFARKRKWYDLGGELHPLMAWAVACLVFGGIPTLAWIIRPWSTAVFHWLFG